MANLGTPFTTYYSAPFTRGLEDATLTWGWVPPYVIAETLANKLTAYSTINPPFQYCGPYTYDVKIDASTALPTSVFKFEYLTGQTYS
jgi:hypothetical protein